MRNIALSRFLLFWVGGISLFLSCQSRVAPVAVDPVFHCGAPAIDTAVYSETLEQEADTTIESIDLMTRWHVIHPDTSINFDQAIDDNLEAINAAMQGYIHYDRDSFIWHITEDVSISELMNEDVLEKSLSDRYGEEGVISVFVLPTKTNLLGYTKLFQSCLGCYEDFAPRYDNIFLSFDALLNKHNYVNGSFEKGEDTGLTAIHEFGHFGSLPHNFDNYKDYMSYHCYRDHFTDDELLRMVTFYINHRNYLIQ